MKEPLPYGEFRWLTKKEIKNVKVETISDHDPYGYILMVDLHYPISLHDTHDQYPLAVEKMFIPDEKLSSLSKKIIKSENLYRSKKIKKLIPNLYDKTDYILHYRNLKLYLKLGLKLKKIHKIITFKQKPWLEEYVDFNIEKRKQAPDDFEKDHWKLLNNCVFGKLLESIRNRKDFKFVTDPQRLLKLTSKPTFHSSRIIDKQLALIEMKQSPLRLNKPIFAGYVILELSKLLMYKFHYKFILKKFKNKVNLLFTDTDSLCYIFDHPDTFKIFKKFEKKYFDFSNYPKNHKMYSNTNKGKPGLFKNVCPYPPIQEFVGLKSKMYSLKQDQGKVKKTAKGVKKHLIKNIDFEDYLSTLLNNSKTFHKFRHIRSYKHQLYTVQQEKLGLSNFDDKRYILKNNINTRAFGNYLNSTEFQ
jgi:hypothetical protein